MAKPKTAGTARASKPRKSATKAPPKAGAKTQPGASRAKPLKARNGGDVAVMLSAGNPRIGKATGDAPVQADITRATATPASALIDQRIRDLAGWRGETLARMRALILEADA